MKNLIIWGVVMFAVLSAEPKVFGNVPHPRVEQFHDRIGSMFLKYDSEPIAAYPDCKVRLSNLGVNSELQEIEFVYANDPEYSISDSPRFTLATSMTFRERLYDHAKIWSVENAGAFGAGICGMRSRYLYSKSNLIILENAISIEALVVCESGTSSFSGICVFSK